MHFHQDSALPGQRLCTSQPRATPWVWIAREASPERAGQTDRIALFLSRFQGSGRSPSNLRALPWAGLWTHLWCAVGNAVEKRITRSKNGVLVALAALLFFAGNALALSPNEWRFRQPLDVPAAGLIRIDLPPATLDSARPGLEDLRLIDNAGQEVAFLIEQPAPQPATQLRPRSFRASVEPGATVLAIETGIATPIAGLTLESPSGAFMKIARIEGSTDGETWTQLVAPRPMLRLPNGVVQLDAEFAPGVWKLLRVTLDDRRTVPAPFAGALLLGERIEAPTTTGTATIRSRDESPGVTRLAVDLGAANLRVARLTLETSDPLFTRALTLAVPEISEDGIREQQIADGAVHRIAVDDNIAEHLDVRIERQVNTRELFVLIRNQDSPPLAITGVRATLRPACLLFLAREPGTFQLLTGNSQCPAPRYDLTPLAGRLKTAPAATATPSTLAPNPDFHSPETLPGVGGNAAALDVSAWKFHRPIVIESSGVQRLDLDLDVLAHAARSFGDLRVVRGGKQIPYLLARTSIQRAIALQTAPANDPQRPRLSRWSLTLPKPGLPLTRIVCASSTPLFERELRLSEEVPDERGGKFPRDIGRANWQHTPDHPASEVAIDFSQPPATAALLLETDNADNPPIDLANPRAFHPVTRLVFKAAPGEPLELFYGNDRTAAPRYDLRHVATQLLGAEKTLATLGPETPVEKSPHRERKEPSGTGGIAFWLVLALVVAGLLLVLARLLPHPPGV